MHVFWIDLEIRRRAAQTKPFPCPVEGETHQLLDVGIEGKSLCHGCSSTSTGFHYLAFSQVFD